MRKLDSVALDSAVPERVAEKAKHPAIRPGVLECSIELYSVSTSCCDDSLWASSAHPAIDRFVSTFEFRVESACANLRRRGGCNPATSPRLNYSLRPAVPGRSPVWHQELIECLR